VTAYDVDDTGRLRKTGCQATGGSGAAHLAVHPSGRYVLVANLRAGGISVHGLAPDGSLCASTGDIRSVRSVPARNSRVHQVHFDPTGAFVLAADIGQDAIHSYALDLDNGQLTAVSRATTPVGTGPRHVLFDRAGSVHVTGQSNATVVTFHHDSGVLTQASVVPSTEHPRHRDVLPSGLVMSADGRFLYVANRGADVITTFAVKDCGLEPIADTAAGGVWPRHVAVVGAHMYVANQKSHQVSRLQLDQRSGVPFAAGGPVRVPSPACIVPGRAATSCPGGGGPTHV
jgi:6-phosphogluconolactonase